MPKHILFCTDGVFPHAVGGMQRHSRLLIEELASMKDIKLTVIHPHQQKVFDASLGIEEIGLEGINPKKNYLLECYKYSKRISVHVDKYPEAITYSQGFAVWHKCSRYRNRLIVNPHGLEPYQALQLKDKLIGFLFIKISNYIFQNSRYVISLGGKLTDILKANIADKSKVVTIPNAVHAKEDISQSLPDFTSDVVQALFVSRFAHNKGISILIDTIIRLKENGYEDKFKFNLVGKGPLFEHYSTKFKLNNVHYLGFVDDNELERLYKNATVFVFPTLFEGMPTVVLEAMAKGLPVIVSDTGATAEQVDQSNGYLIKKNSVTALYEALIAFLNLSPTEKEGMGLKSHQKVMDRFTWKQVAQMHQKLFEQV